MNRLYEREQISAPFKTSGMETGQTQVRDDASCVWVFKYISWTIKIILLVKFIGFGQIILNVNYLFIFSDSETGCIDLTKLECNFKASGGKPDSYNCKAKLSLFES